MTFEKEPEFSPEPPSPARRLWLVLGGAGLIVVAGLLFSVLRNTTPEAREPENPAAVAGWRAEAEKLRLELGTGEPDHDRQMRVIESLLRLERSLAEAEPGGLTLRLPEITRLERELDRLLATAKLELSRAREVEFTARLEAGEVAEAERALREARDLQREVNRTAGDARRDRQREARLERDYIRLVAEPLLARLEAAMTRAETALTARDWGAAIEEFRTARQLQERLNREFPRSRFSDLARVSKIDAEIAALGAAELDLEAVGSLQRAREHAAAGREAEAVAAFDAAAAAQSRLNAEFSRSRFVTMERLEEIEEGRQTVLAQAAWRQAAELDRTARAHLRRRQLFLATGALREAGARLAEVRDRWPRARGGDEQLRLRVSYLNARADTLGLLQDRCYEALRPLPGQPGPAMLRNLVTQQDFSAVMSRNPSRGPNSAGPVDSVSPEEAQEFCLRLSWVLGREVRLPTAAELGAALREAPEDFPALTAAGGGEWVGPAQDGGGLDWVASDGRVQRASAGQRARDRFFRVVVAVDLLSPEN